MKRRRKKEPFVLPTTPKERAELAAKLRKRWPHPVGTDVRYWPVRTGRLLSGEPVYTRTRTAAFVDENGETVIFLAGHAGYVLVSHLEVLTP